MARILAPTRTSRIDATKRHEQRFSWFIAEAHRQANNRAQRARWERYYDSEQIDPAVRAEIEARGQTVVVFNEIKSTIDWLIGTERRQRIDFHIMPRDAIDRDASKDAEVKSKVLKWLADVNRAGFERSQAFDDAMKSGLGWMEVGVRGDPNDPSIYIAHAPWREVLHDSMAQRLDLSDARYIFRIKIVDLDVALAMFPDKEKELLKVRQDGDDMQAFSTWMGGTGNLLDLGLLNGMSADDGDGYDNAVPPDLFNPRERVLLVECWCIEPNGQAGRDTPSTYDRAGMSMRVSIMTEYDTIAEEWSPYKHGRFPFIPKWAYRNKRTGLPYSPIRALMDKQDALNQALSKALHEASVNQTIAEVGAFESEIMTPEQVHAEMMDPEGMAIVANGALGNGRFKTERGIDRARGQMMMAEIFRLGIREGSSVTDANKGRDTNATSGKAIGLQQDQGSVLTTELFDNDLLARQQEGELTLSLVEQYMTGPRVIALSGDRKQSQMVEVNKPQPDGTVLNDLAARSAQFVVGEQAWRQTLAHSAFESMMELMGNLAQTAPQVVVACLDLILEYADVPNKEALLERVRAVTGQPGPDNQETPEQLAAKQQQQALQQKQIELQMAEFEAKVKETIAKGDKVAADAILARLNAMLAAATGAAQIVTAPGAMPIADEMLKSAGFVDQNAAAPVLDASAPPALAAPVDPAMADPGAQPMPPEALPPEGAAPSDSQAPMPGAPA
jgi:hypothetical protein